MFGLDEAKIALDARRLTSMIFDDYLFIMNIKFDITIAGEPYHARTMLYNTKSGRLLSRIWGKTVSSVNVHTLEDFNESCKGHFRGGRLCLGLFPTKAEQDTFNFHMSLTPVFRKISKHCPGVIRGETSASSIACEECQKLVDMKVDIIGSDTLDSEPKNTISTPSPSPKRIKNIDLPIAPTSEDTSLERHTGQLDLSELSQGDFDISHYSATHSPPPITPPIGSDNVFNEPKNIINTTCPLSKRIENIDLPTAPRTDDISVKQLVDLAKLSEGCFEDNHYSAMHSPSPPHLEPKITSHPPCWVEKPQLSYAQMIAEALMQAEDRMLPLCEIYTYINQKYPYFHMDAKSWQNAIRHNLTLVPSFQKVPRPNNEGRGNFWTMQDGAERQIFKRQIRSQHHPKGRYELGGSGGSVGSKQQQLKGQNAPLEGELCPSIEHDVSKESGVMYIANQAVYWQEIAHKYPHIMKTGKPFKIKIKTEDSKGCLQEKVLLVDPNQTLQQGGIVETLSENDLNQTKRGNLKQYVKNEMEETNSLTSNQVKSVKSSGDDQTPNIVKANSEESANESFSEHEEDNKTQKREAKEQCQFCKKRFQQINALNCHVNETHYKYEEIFRCPICYHRASNVERLKAHMEQTNHNKWNPSIKCPKCLIQFQLADLLSHYVNCLKPQSEDVSKEKQLIFTPMPQTSEPQVAPNIEMDLPVTPPTNDALGGDDENLTRHKSNTETQPESEDYFDSKLKHFICPYCNKGIKSALLLSHHKRLTHLWGRFSCPECDTIFSLLKDLMKHMYDANHDRNPLVKCGSGFGGMGKYRNGGGCRSRMDIEYLSDHYVQCVAEKIKKRETITKVLRKCEVCGKVCKGKGAYRAHSLTHTEERNVQCDRCPKRFKTKSLLRSHIKTVHEGRYDPVDPCSICSETFKFKASLKVHQYRAHGVGDLMLCPHCGFKCFTPTRLKLHMLSHEDATLQCSYCKKMLKNKKNLESHERIHTGEKPYTCSICDAGFPSEKGLAQHKSGVHKITGPRGKAPGWKPKKGDRVNYYVNNP